MLLIPGHLNKTSILGVVLCVFYSFLSARANSDLPSLRELIQKTDEAITAREKENDEGIAWPLGELAVAQAYAGDFSGAVRTARRIRGAWRSTILLSCREIHFEQTGKCDEIRPEDFSEVKELQNNARTHAQVEMAKVFVKAGRTPEAMKLLPQEPATREIAYFLKDFYLFLAEQQAKQQDTKDAAASLRHAWQYWEQTGIRTTRMEWFEQVALLFKKLGEPAQARIINNVAIKQMRDRTQKEEAHVILSQEWAELGGLNVELGEKDQADECFREALRLADAAQQKNQAHADLGLQLYVGNLGHIAACLEKAGRKGEARDVLNLAFEKDAQIEGAATRDFALFQLIESLFPENDEYALDIVKQMRDTYWKSYGYSVFALKLADTGRKETARSFLKKAEPLATARRDANSTISLWEKMAEVSSKLGDASGARRSLARALQVSRTTKDNQYHPGIARCQIRLGMLDDAYATIQAISQSEFQLLPLAELTRALAKQEARRGPVSND